MSDKDQAYKSMLRAHKKPWTHSRACDYCQSRGIEIPCRHFRGGKTKSDRRS